MDLKKDKQPSISEIKITTFEEIEETPFRVVSLEKGTWGIVLGNMLATRREYTTREDAIASVSAIDWDLVLSFIGNFIDNQKLISKWQHENK